MRHHDIAPPLLGFAARLLRNSPRNSHVWLGGGCSAPAAHLWSENRTCYLQMQVRSRKVAHLLAATGAIGRCEAKRRHPDRDAMALPDSAPLRSYCAYASVQLCRYLLSFAFHLATPAISWKRASRRERDAPLQLHAGTGRILVLACRVCKNVYQNLRIRTVTARSDAHSRLDRRAASAGRFVRTTQHLGSPCTAELGGRVRSWVTAAAPHSVAYQVMSDRLFMASHRCVAEHCV
jgi:hypothetical protein